VGCVVVVVAIVVARFTVIGGAKLFRVGELHPATTMPVTVVKTINNATCLMTVLTPDSPCTDPALPEAGTVPVTTIPSRTLRRTGCHDGDGLERLTEHRRRGRTMVEPGRRTERIGGWESGFTTSPSLQLGGGHSAGNSRSKRRRGTVELASMVPQQHRSPDTTGYRTDDTGAWEHPFPGT